MRTLLALFTGLLVLLTGYWAYQQNYLTRLEVAELEKVQRDLHMLRARKEVLEVEWAYLNRPERLRRLADLNFERLGLLPMSPDHFGDIDRIAYPPRPPLPPSNLDEFESDELDDSELVLAVGLDGEVVDDIATIQPPEQTPDARDGQFP
ncbi:MAG: cell division protein FtsL [Pseudomonadota bacterium]